MTSFPTWPVWHDPHGPDDIAAVVDLLPPATLEWFAARTAAEVVAHRAAWLDVHSAQTLTGLRWHAVALFTVRRLLSSHTIDQALLCDGAPVVVVSYAADPADGARALDAALREVPALGVSALWLVARGSSTAQIRAVGSAEGWVEIEPDLIEALLEPGALKVSIDLLAVGGVVADPRVPAAVAQIVERAEAPGARALVSTPDVARVTVAAAAALAAGGRTVAVVAAGGRDKDLRRAAAELSVEADVKIYTLHAQPMDVAHVLLFPEVDSGFRGEAGWAWRAANADAVVVGVTGLEVEAIALDLRHAFGDPHDPDGVLPTVPAPSPAIDVVSVRWRMALVHSEAEEAEHIAFGLVDAVPAGTGPTLVLVEDGFAELVAEAVVGEGRKAVDATSWGNANAGWDMLKEDEQDVFVIRTSLPWSRSGLRVRRVVLLRQVGPTTLSRLVRALRAASAPATAGELLVQRGAEGELHPYLHGGDRFVDRDLPSLFR